MTADPSPVEPSGPVLEFHADAGRFLAAAGDLLAADPLVASVVAVVAEREVARAAAEPGSPRPEELQWFLVVRDPAGAVVGAAMRTAPFEPHPAFVLPLSEQAAVALARALHARGEFLGGVNGAVPAARVVAEETARLWGGTARVDEHTCLHELDGLVVPPAPPGRLRPATPDDVPLCLAWLRDFEAAAAAQAGREPSHDGSHWSLEDVRRRTEAGTVWLWVLDDGTPGGRPVHLTASSHPVDGMSRIGPVYTPRESRGHGYARRAVAEVAGLRVAGGARVSLFTDLANPTSNALYAAIGFRPVLDMVNMLVVPEGGGPARLAAP